MSKRFAEDDLAADSKRTKLIERVFTQEIMWSAENPRALQFLGYTIYLDDPNPLATTQETRALQLLALVLNEKLALGEFVLYGTQLKLPLILGIPVLCLEPNTKDCQISGRPTLVFRGSTRDNDQFISIHQNTMFVPRDRAIQLAEDDYKRAIDNECLESIIDIFLEELKTDKNNPLSCRSLCGPRYHREIVVTENISVDKTYSLPCGQMRILKQRVAFNVVFWNSRHMIIYDFHLVMHNGHTDHTRSYLAHVRDWNLDMGNLGFMMSRDFKKIHSVSGSTDGLFGAIKLVYADGGAEVDCEALRKLEMKHRPLVRFEFGGGAHELQDK